MGKSHKIKLSKKLYAKGYVWYNKIYVHLNPQKYYKDLQINNYVVKQRNSMVRETSNLRVVNISREERNNKIIGCTDFAYCLSKREPK